MLGEFRAVTTYFVVLVKYVTGHWPPYALILCARAAKQVEGSSIEIVIFRNLNSGPETSSMVTKAEISAYRTAFMTNAGCDAPVGRTPRLHMILWSVLFAMAVFGGLLS
jgi:hypothetical protein